MLASPHTGQAGKAGCFLSSRARERDLCKVALTLPRKDTPESPALPVIQAVTQMHRGLPARAENLLPDLGDQRTGLLLTLFKEIHKGTLAWSQVHIQGSRRQNCFNALIYVCQLQLVCMGKSPKRESALHSCHHLQTPRLTVCSPSSNLEVTAH